MNFDLLLDALTAEKYAVLKQSVELGKWSDGRILNEEEKSTSLRLLIAFDIKHKPEEERIGYIPPKNKQSDNHRADNKASSVDVIHKE